MVQFMFQLAAPLLAAALVTNLCVVLIWRGRSEKRPFGMTKSPLIVATLAMAFTIVSGAYFLHNETSAERIVVGIIFFPWMTVYNGGAAYLATWLLNDAIERSRKSRQTPKSNDETSEGTTRPDTNPNQMTAKNPASSPPTLTGLAGALLGAAIGGAVTSAGSMVFLRVYAALEFRDEFGPPHFLLWSTLCGLLLGCFGGLLVDAGRKPMRAYLKDAYRRGADALFQFAASNRKSLLVFMLVASMLCIFLFLLFGAFTGL